MTRLAIAVFACLLLGGATNQNRFQYPANISLFERFEFIKSAALRGDPAAMCALGECYASSTGTKQDFTAALEWFRRSANAGFIEGQIALARLYLEGRIWETGKIAPQPHESIRWFMAAANLGSAEAQHILGTQYDDGVFKDKSSGLVKGKASIRLPRSVAPTNLPEARRFYAMAAARGYAPSLNSLGVMLWIGQGGAINRIEAYKNVRLAALRDMDAAKENVAIMEKSMSGLEISEGQRRADSSPSRLIKKP